MKLLKTALFHIEYKIMMITMRKLQDNLFSFPMIIYLTFNKDTIRKKYLAGKSLQSQLKIKAASIARQLTREPSFEVLNRYYQFCEYYQEKRETGYEIDEFIEKYVKPQQQETAKGGDNKPSGEKPFNAGQTATIVFLIIIACLLIWHILTKEPTLRLL